MSAIQPDVQNDDVAATAATATAAEPAPDPVVTQKSAREEALAALEARHQASMAEANGWQLPGDPAPEPEPVPDPDAAQLEAQLTEPQPEPAPAPAPAAPQLVKVKIDGQEAEVPVEDLVRQYQKHSTADKRLAEATRLLREAQEAEAARLLREQQMQAQLQQQQQQPQLQDPNKDTVDADSIGARKDFLKALFEGDEENALTKLDQMLAGRQQAPAPAPILDVDRLTQAVTQNVQQKLVVESVLKQNRTDYPEMYADPDMESLALAKIQRKQAEEGIDFFSALDAVSKDMASKFGWSAATPAPAPEPDPGRRVDPAPTTSSRAQKLEAKQRIDNVSSINTKPAPTEPQPEDASSIIAAMRAARAGG